MKSSIYSIYNIRFTTKSDEGITTENNSESDTYELDASNGKQLSILKRGADPAIKTGLNQPNLLAAVAQGSSIDLYVNGQHIAYLTDTTASRGLIGVAADASVITLPPVTFLCILT